MRKAVRIVAVISLLLILASIPTCYFGERAVQTELSKLSPAELNRKQFDAEYVRIVLPGIFLFVSGVSLAVVACVLRFAEYVMNRPVASDER